jgi:hypothetical protein
MARIDVEYGRFQPKYRKNSYNPHDALAFALASHLA